MQHIAKGKLVVIEGGDGSGKATQSKLLLEYLQTHQIPCMYLDFPNYDSFFGSMIAQFLRGEYGSLDTVSPYLASLLFALDRSTVKDQMMKALAEGKIIVVNRYVSSNMAHQGSKFTDLQKREKFIAWLRKLEFEIHGLPEEDLIIYLYVPWQRGRELTAQKGDRSYLEGKTEDIQEENHDHRAQTEDMYKELAKDTSRWLTISCIKDDTMKSKEEINQMIVEVLQKNHIF
jgi:dTMP kinase